MAETKFASPTQNEVLNPVEQRVEGGGVATIAGESALKNERMELGSSDIDSLLAMVENAEKAYHQQLGADVDNYLRSNGYIK